MNLYEHYPGVYLRGAKPNSPFYTLKDLSAASGLPIFIGQKDAKIIFNWGIGGYSIKSLNLKSHLNSSCIIDKFKASKLMIKSGCSTPRSWIKYEEICYPVLVKPIFSYGGYGIQLLEGKQDKIKTKPPFWFQEYIYKVREYRVYFFLDHVVRISEKIPLDKNLVTWNRKYCNAWYNVYDLKLEKSLNSLLNKAFRALRIDWGAADVIEDRNGKFWILEINSRPSIIYPGGERTSFKKDKYGIYHAIDSHLISSTSKMWAKEFRNFLLLNY